MDGEAAFKVGGHIALQAAFVAPGLMLFGVRGWRLLGASLAGSASFTLLSWIWAAVNGYEMIPMGERRFASRRQAPSTGAPGLPPQRAADADVIDI